MHAVHKESGAKMVPFGGWDMPVEYSGLIAEHQAVRTAAGLFDVSHMGEFEVTGPGALAFLQRVTANDVAKLAVGQAQYSALPMPSGCPVDDVIVYRRGEERYLIVVNAANADKDWAWLRAQGPSDCALDDQSEAYALLALQGPRAQAILQGLTPIDLGQVAFYQFAEGRVNGEEAIVARTGVWRVGWIAPIDFGSRPSRLSAKMIRPTVTSSTSITDVRPHTAETPTSTLAHPSPTWSKASEIGAPSDRSTYFTMPTSTRHTSM